MLFRQKFLDKINILRKFYKLSQSIEEKPCNAERWHSWDSAPWKHPWLTSANIRNMRQYSELIWRNVRTQSLMHDASRLKYGFVGNMANNLYMRAAPLRKRGIDISIFIHPSDQYVMSQPGWEEYNGIMEEEQSLEGSFKDLLPYVENVYQEKPIEVGAYLNNFELLPAYLDPKFYENYPDYLPYLGTLEKLQEMDALLAVQSPYLAYFSKRPYLVTQMGGEIWYECSRDDAYGRLQRLSFCSANAFLISNPWSFAHARRYGMTNLVYLPINLDEEKYAPGEPRWREKWIQEKGGDFFVLCTARLDNFYKGSDLALKGFFQFSQINPGARLVLTCWGKDKEKLLDVLSQEYNLADKVIFLPISGKERLIEYLRSADCLLDQFTLGYYGATALEAMACGLPVIMKLELQQYEALCSSTPPMRNSSTATEICQELLTLSSSLELRKVSSERHREWFMNNHSTKKWGSLYQDFLCVTAKGFIFDHSSSPLRARLSRKERKYHREQLKIAPIFPNYSF